MDRFANAVADTLTDDWSFHLASRGEAIILRSAAVEARVLLAGTSPRSRSVLIDVWSERPIPGRVEALELNTRALREEDEQLSAAIVRLGRRALVPGPDDRVEGQPYRARISGCLDCLRLPTPWRSRCTACRGSGNALSGRGWVERAAGYTVSYLRKQARDAERNGWSAPAPQRDTADTCVGCGRHDAIDPWTEGPWCGPCLDADIELSDGRSDPPKFGGGFYRTRRSGKSADYIGGVWRGEVVFPALCSPLWPNGRPFPYETRPRDCPDCGRVRDFLGRAAKRGRFEVNCGACLRDADKMRALVEQRSNMLRVARDATRWRTR